MLRGGVIMDVVTAEQARIAEDAGACAVTVLERVPADIRAQGGVARMSAPELIIRIKESVSIPVMAKCRIGHFVEAQILEALNVDYIDESEVLTPADEEHHILKQNFIVPFVCGCRSKDSCEFRCIDHPDGMQLLTREGQPFLAFNGIQTQSARTYNLIHELAELSQLGVDVLRISPQSSNTFEIVKLFRQCLERSITADLAARQLESLMPNGACNGYRHGRPELEQVAASHRTVEA